MPREPTAARPSGIRCCASEPPPSDADACLYRARVPSTRPATDYTARAIPSFPGAAVPIEAAHILWQR